MRRCGFTLLEVLISLAIMAMIMTTVMQTVDSTRMAVDAIHNIMETENNGPRIVERMREDMENIAVYDVKDYKAFKGVNRTLMGAEADQMDMLVRSRGKTAVNVPGIDRPVYAPLNEVGYRLRANPLRDEFMELYRREDALVDDEPFRDGTYTMLYDRVVSLQIRYTKEPDVNPLWVDDWDSEIRQTLPFAVDIFLELEVQPRRSLESLNIIGANRARLEFNEVYHYPERTRWRFRNRLHSSQPGEEDGTSSGEGTDADGTTGGADAEGLPGGVLPSGGLRTGGSSRGGLDGAKATGSAPRDD
ncbi:MAG: prepilin-type N-terminal cleavage/methylation domain-containing protein [Planctomycetota bacterium]|jgi:type II secretion system protein J|nr:prepilin-type N-terminal cleavage/methylation domain-containing protein [Planctomycetota bacterium]